MNAKKIERFSIVGNNVDCDPEVVAGYLKVLGNPIRLKIIKILIRGEQNVGDLERALNTSQSNVSQHLRILKDRKLITSRKKANEVYYSITDNKISSVLEHAKDYFCALTAS